MKKVWRKNFEITRTHLQMGSPALFDMMVYQSPTVLKAIIREAIWIQKGYDNVGTYFPISQLRGLINATLEAIIKNPQKIHDVHKKTLAYNQELFQFSRNLLRKEVRALTNDQLSKLYKKFINLFVISHGYALPTTWFLDSDGEDFSNFLQQQLKQIIVKKNSLLNFVECFSILTTPEKSSLAVNEEIESLKVLNLINQNQQAKKLFLKDIKTIQAGLKNLQPKIRQKIKTHFNKWRWQSYTYMGPAYELDYYLEIWRGLLKQKINIQKELNRLRSQTPEIKSAKAKIIKELKLDQQTQGLFKTACDIIYLKSYRKDAWFFACYAAEGLYKEIGRRLGLSLNQVWFMSCWEVTPALTKGAFPADLLNKRMEFCVFYQRGKKADIYTGQKAKLFLKSLNLEKVKRIKKINELKGTCAYPGKAKGIVKIINQVEDVGKMNKGDIMLAHTTFPALVPAMKKASAIVTDDGGVTCHAAIVARELRIPSVVGTKIATKVLKDGDRVEVDATKGIVRKL
ncbi:hypothetical protein A2773_06000 [Candidatus Gottesmanbacteria bacterium RIFCSPHIGHO2_01_FULL_39_10]|uniref:PEP-utilising enzyme mobile domain-containing protein n=1 Tax=Candidatus Gottesmanbacteria bacterium RIFCSPHIGHO2_01_FULL_39_10 TaxID=1798375 RepID=A0A1F5ZPT2_9BACT|nr:MAG: hypothetical protein A2773_06000 [Candidatus Gottesmanbacteria bacterium RIFCSPHIGHO2_01_FULL_39_10]